MRDMSKFIETKFSNQKIINVIKHEIRNPLTNIKTFLETLYEYHFQLTDLQILEFLEVVTRETNRLIRLTNNSLYISRFNTFYSLTFFNLFFLGRVIKQISGSYGLAFLTKNAFLYFKLHIQFLKTVGNYDLFVQIIYNLIDNALKSICPQGVIVIKLKSIYFISLRNRKPISLLRVDIIDTGAGMQKINSVLRSVELSPLKKRIYLKNGTGMGLSIVEDALFIHKKRAHISSLHNKGMNVFFNLS